MLVSIPSVGSWRAGICPQVPLTEPSTINTGLTYPSNQRPLPALLFRLTALYPSSGPLRSETCPWTIPLQQPPHSPSGPLCSEPPPNCLLGCSLPPLSNRPTAPRPPASSGQIQAPLSLDHTLAPIRVSSQCAS